MNFRILKAISAAVVISAGVIVTAQDTQTLRNQAEEKLKVKDSASAVELFQKAISSAGDNIEAKKQIHNRLAWVYAWGMSSNHFDKAAEEMVESSKLEKDPSKRSAILRSAADYLNRIQGNDGKKIVEIISPIVRESDVNVPEKVACYLVLANAASRHDMAASMKYIDEAASLDCDSASMKNIRFAASGILMRQTEPDYDGAVVQLKKLVDSPKVDGRDKVVAQLETGRILSAGKKPRLENANAELKKVAEMPGASADDKAGASMLLADNSLKLKIPDYESAVAAYRSVAADTLVNRSARKDAAFKQIRVMRDNLRMDKKDILSAYESMWKIPDLDFRQRRDISASQGDYLLAQNEYAEARKAYARFLDTDKEKDAANVAAGYIAKVDAAEGRFDAAVEGYKKAGRFADAATVLFGINKKAEANRLLADAVKDSVNAKQNLAALMRLNSFRDASALLEGELKPIIDANPSLADEIYGSKLRTAMEYAAYEFVETTVPLILKSGIDKRPKDYAFTLLYQINAFAQMGRNDDTMRCIEAAAKDEKVTLPEFQFRFKVLSDALKANSRKAASEAAAKNVDAFKSRLDVKLIPKTLSDAASSAVMLNRREIAEGIEDARKALYAPMPNKKADCPYVDGLSGDISGWMASDIVKKKIGAMRLDRQLWESDVEFLLATDAAVTGRGVAESKASGGVDTELYFRCSDKGVYVFMIAYDDNARAIANGLAGGGSYEGYLAPGAFQPYHCFLVDIGSGKADDFISAYKNSFSRRPTFGDFELKTQSALVADNANATLIFYPWEYFYNVIPDGKGDTWQFDVMRWTGKGSSWSGTKSVHNRSTWGDMVFDLTPKQLASIRRNIVYKALAHYKGMLGSAWRGTGIFNFWSDPELGDVEFYNARLAPLKAKLDAYAKEIKPDMTDEAVNELFLKAVPEFFKLQYTVSNLRDGWLSDKWFEGRK